MAQPILDAMMICLCHFPEKLCSQETLEQSYAGPASVADEKELRTQRIGPWPGLGVRGHGSTHFGCHDNLPMPFARNVLQSRDT